MAQAFAGTVFIDGSCENQGPRSWHLATWSVIAQDDRGNLTASLTGAVGRALPPTSVAGEYVAGLAVLQHCPMTDLALTDYQSLAGLQDLTRAQLTNPGNYYSGLRWQIRSGVAWQPHTRLAKVKAHQDLSSLAAGTEELWRAQGNDHADVQAK